jgi:hypothetical protein
MNVNHRYLSLTVLFFVLFFQLSTVTHNFIHPVVQDGSSCVLCLHSPGGYQDIVIPSTYYPKDDLLVVLHAPILTAVRSPSSFTLHFARAPPSPLIIV